jgi:hypothetical protein
VVPCKPGETFWATASGGERLGHKYDVWLRGKFLVGEIAASASKAALNFVGDQEGAVFCGEDAGAIPKILTDGVDSAFTLNGFEENGTDGVVELGFEVGDIVEADEFDAGNERSEWQTIFFRGGDADSAKSAAVEGVFESQDAVFASRSTGRIGGSAAIEASELESAFDRFGAAVREKHAVHTGPMGKLAGQRTLERVVKKIRKMDRASRFAADDFDDARMRMAEGVDGDAAEKIEIFLAARIIDVAAAAMGEDNGLALVRGHKKLIRIAQNGMGILSATRAFLSRSSSGFRLLFWSEFGHYAAERAFWALGKDSRRTRVPGIGKECSSVACSAE